MPLDQIDVDSMDEKEDAEGVEMSFFDHIDALRGHLIRSVIVLFVLTITIFCYKDFVFNSIIFAPLQKDFVTYQVLCGFSQATCFDTPKLFLRTNTLGEAFFMHMMVSFWLALTCGFPYLVWELWRFVRPGLYDNEQSMAGGLMAVIGLLFAFGVGFGYYIVAPLAMVFLANYEIPGVVNQTSIESYVDSLVMFTIPLGFVFELPIIMYFLGKMGIVTAQLLKNSRRYAVVILMIISAIVTPSPDAWTMTLVFLPLYGLYELSIVVVGRDEKKRALAEKNQN